MPVNGMLCMPLRGREGPYMDLEKCQEECLVRRQHRMEEILMNKEACRLRKEVPDRKREETNQ
ncbi:hypothetical protein KY290_008356 [Solanum tuberosum]|uniref:Uncharacterized protein n=1 Tax=Solanum tuberosum TaxID=4113 RepID=A0ABQ7W8N6_SOLTU|nr:hypothetical protein KY284_008285 [Solanum tuberosum]KAH0776945.1 hypothetical protein KY290_008356 [Solanum tuberosum]